MFKYITPLAVALAAALVAAGVALTRSSSPSHRSVAAVGSPFHLSRSEPRAAERSHPHVVRVVRHVIPRVSTSLYEQTVNPSVLRAQGCAAAKDLVSGIVILDFGKPDYDGHAYGTILFSDTFASDRRITRAMLSYATGYHRCRVPNSDQNIVLARGTSNYSPSVPSAYRAGQKWARETLALSRLLDSSGISAHVAAAAAVDAEPAWDPSFHQTFDFFRGYRASGVGRPLYNYGSLDGGVGSIWNTWQAYYVAGGMRYAQPIPEIYNRAMAKEWAHLAWLAEQRYHRPLHFAGVMTQRAAGCACGLRPATAHQELVRELAARRLEASVPPTLTNIRAPQ